MNSDFILALEEIEREKGVSREVVFDALEKALVKSYEHNYDSRQNVLVNIDRKSGLIRVLSERTVVDQVEDSVLEIGLDNAREIDPKIQVGDTLAIEVTPKDFGRIAAQKARNIVIQKIKDAERDAIYNEFVDRQNEIVTAKIQRIDRGSVYVDLGKSEGMMLPAEQVKDEVYRVNDRIKVFIYEVKNQTKGAQILVSRANAGLVRRLFELEVPEIADGTVELFSISREAGSRSKIAVFAEDPAVDPVGACVGFKGQRVNAIVDALDGEKIDIVVYDKDIKTFIANALSPSEVLEVRINDPQKAARVIVPDDQLSLAIGKEGQNVRLAAKLTGWKIDIKGRSQQLQLEEEGTDTFEVVEKKYGKAKSGAQVQAESTAQVQDPLAFEAEENEVEAVLSREDDLILETEETEKSIETGKNVRLEDLVLPIEAKDKLKEADTDESLSDSIFNGLNLDELMAAMTDFKMDDDE